MTLMGEERFPELVKSASSKAALGHLVPIYSVVVALLRLAPRTEVVVVGHAVEAVKPQILMPVVPSDDVE
jgi:hypothetical protein